MNNRRSRAGAACLLLTTLLAWASPLAAVEITVQNDDFVNNGPATVLGDFAVGEHGGVRLTSPCNGAIVAVQIGWLSQGGGQPQSLEQAIHIFADDAAFPTPGTELETLVGPVLTDGALNEFRFVDDQGAIPLNVPVTAGQQFYVTLEFANPTNIAAGTPSLFVDVSACQNGKNVLFGNVPPFGFGWFDFCFIGISGDIVIRAVIDCPSFGGACCLPDGSCLDTTQTDCQTQGGVFRGNGTDCISNPCLGACCQPDGTCQESVDGANCPNPLVNFFLDLTCAQVPGGCPLPTGSCCMPTGGVPCLDGLIETDCATLGGTWLGPATICVVDACKAACCFQPTGCVDLTLLDCTTAAGFWQGAGTACATFTCFPTGACCMPDGSCNDNVLDADCIAAGGTFQGDGVLCSAVNCPQPSGACCLANGACLFLLQTDCLNIPGATWAGPFTDCTDANSNGTADACETATPDGNINGDAATNGLDIQAFVNAVFGTPTQPEIDAGDFDGDGTLGSGDVTGLVNALLTAP
ncbi:MAG: hypothetical protein ACE5E1_09680 [Phycisphaerae bacterium]